VRFVPTYDPSRDANWVPAKILNGQYIAGHFKGDPVFAVADGPPRTIPWRADPPTRTTQAASLAVSRGPGYSPPYRFRMTARGRETIYGSPAEGPSSATSTANQPERDAHGRFKRSESAKHTFMRMTGYPNGRPGYVVDHIIPLKRGGADDPSNMQWQTVEEAKAKDKWE
jgi:hypothetical protein